MGGKENPSLVSYYPLSPKKELAHTPFHFPSPFIQNIQFFLSNFFFLLGKETYLFVGLSFFYATPPPPVSPFFLPLFPPFLLLSFGGRGNAGEGGWGEERKKEREERV